MQHKGNSFQKPRADVSAPAKHQWRPARPGAFLIALVIAISALFLHLPSASAQAGCTGAACVGAGTTVAELDSTQSPILNAILENLLDGSTVNLSAADYNTLLDAQLDLSALLTQLQADLSLGSPHEALTTDITLGDLLLAAATVHEDTATVSVLNDLATVVAPLTGTIQLGDLLEITSGSGSLSDIDLNLLDLVFGSIQLFNYENVAATPAGVTISGAALGLGGVIGEITVRATVIEAPVIVCGPAGSSFNSAAMRVAITVDDLLTAGINTTILTLADLDVSIDQLELYLDVGRGQGTIQTVDAISKAVTIEATPGVVSLYLGSMDHNTFFDRTQPITAANLTPGLVGSLELSIVAVGTVESDLTLRAVATSGATSPEILSFSAPYPETQTTAVGAGALNSLLLTLLDSDNLEVGFDLESDPTALSAILSALSTTLQDLTDTITDAINTLVIDPILAPILDDLVVDLLDDVLDALGLTVGKMTVTVHDAYALCPSLTVTKTHSGDFNAGDTGVYVITVTNDGDGEATGPITVTDTLPAGFAYVGFTGDGWSFNAQSGQDVSFTHAGPLAPGASLPPLNLTVSVAVTLTGSATNQVSADTPGNQDDGNSSDSDQTTIIPATPQQLCEQAGICASLTVTITEVGDFPAGGQGTYHVDVTNVGDGSTYGPITVTVTLPDDFGFNASAGSGWSTPTQNGQVLTIIHPGPLDPGDSLPTLVVTVDIPVTATGTVETSAEGDTPGNQDDGNSSDTTQTTVTPATAQQLCEQQGQCPALQLEKRAIGEFVAGELGQYRFVVTNTGTVSTYAPISLNDNLPAGLTYHSHSGEGWTHTGENGDAIEFTHVGPLAPGAVAPSLMLTVSIALELEGEIVNSAVVGTSGNAEGGEIDSDTATVIPPGSTCPESGACPSLTVSKSHAGNFQAGSQGLYTIEVANIGTGPTRGAITVTDTLPAGMSYVSHSGSGWGVLEPVGQTVTLVHPGPLDAGATLPTLLLNVNVDRAMTGSVVNQVTVDTDGNVPNDQSSASDDTTILDYVERVMYAPIMEKAVPSDPLPSGGAN